MKNQKPTTKTTAKKTAVATAKKPVLHSMEEHGAKVQAFIGKRKSAPRSEFVAFMRKYAPAVYSTLARKLEKAGYIVRKTDEVLRGKKQATA